MSAWTQFFKEAGVPSSAAKRYTSIFEDNRITKDLLPDLSKEILLDMGIKVMGDILCILKHAKREVRQTEHISGEGGQQLSPLAHSTTPGHPDPVSTTSVTGRQREIPKDRRGHRPPPTEIEIEPEQVTDALPMLRSDQMLLEVATRRPSAQQVSTITESYSTAAYKKQQKRQAAMYSDEGEEFSPPKQPRVVVLPGEGGQEMYTATAIQRAAAIAASVAIAAQEEIPNSNSQKSRKLLETSGLAPTEGKVGGSSVFSRLDSDSPVSSSHVSSTPSTSHRPQPPPKARVTVDLSKSRVTVDTSKPRTIRLGKESKAAVSTSEPKTRKTSLADRLGRLSSSKHSESSGLRSTSSSKDPPLRMRIGEKGRSSSDMLSSSSASTRKSVSTVKGKSVPRPRSMVADEMDYQTRRQNDIRLRLEVKERAKVARRKGPLEGRLEQHNVFGRLE